LLSASGGALNVQLGGVGAVGAEKIYKPDFGVPGNIVDKDTIPRVIGFFTRSFLLWVVVIFILNVWVSR
jgi:cobalamin biosynthesis protein CobD/CbiB